MASEIQVPRLVVPGDIVIPKGRQKGEVVRNVSVILHMADGTDHIYSDDDEVRIAPKDFVPPSVEELREAHERELKHADEAIERARARLEELDRRRREVEDLMAQAEQLEQQEISELPPRVGGQ